MRSPRRATTVFLSLLLTGSRALARQLNPERNAYFGEQHVHTSWAVDAGLFGNLFARRTK